MNLLQINIKAVFSLIVLLTVQNSFSQTQNSKPNIIIIITDDQGYGDFACHGNPVLRTPALDKLHSESIRLINFHVTPLCTPSRAQLMSGLDGLNNKASTVGAGRNIMRRDIPIMPEIFSYNGYKTGLFGKWHLGDNYPDRPIDRGFQKSIWIKGWGLLSEAEFDNDYYKTRYLDSLETKYSQKYCTDLWFDEAIKWMDGQLDENKPFFTYIATNTPHGPFLSPKSEFIYFKSKGYDDRTSHFLGMIENIDQNIARLEKWLVEKQVKENTIIVYLTDNGTAAGGDVFNAGMRGIKGSNYEGGHRAACFIRWPSGSLSNPNSIEYPSEVQDILPTFIDLLNLKTNEPSHFDGISLKPILLGKKQDATDRMFVVQYSDKNGPEKYFSCVVWNWWRLVGDNELYDLKKDPGQKNNVAIQHPDIKNKMKQYYEKWWEEKQADLNNMVPLLIGSDSENPVILTSDFWNDSSYVNTQWKVAQGGGPSNGGTWYLKAEKTGKYLLELSRWPFHLNRNLTKAGPEKSVGGTNIREGIGLPIEYGCVSINSGVPAVVKKADDTATLVAIEINILKGLNTLQGWFRDSHKKDLCGSYYVRIRKLED